MNQIIKILCCSILFVGISLFDTSVFAQPSVSDPVCAYCRTPLTGGGIHSSSCPYYVAPTTSSSSGSSSPGTAKKKTSSRKSPSLSTNNQIKLQLFQGILDGVTQGVGNNEAAQQQKEAQQEAERQQQFQRAQRQRILELERQRNFADKKDQLLGNLKGSSTGTLGLKPIPEPSDGDGATPFFGSAMPVSPENEPNAVDLRGKKGIVDPNDPSLGYGKIPEDRKIAPTGTEVIKSINALAKQQGWSEEKLTRLNKALCNLDLADKDYLVGTDTEVTKVWNDVEARSLDKILARDLSQGQGPTLPPGAGQQQTNQDCTIFALANATRLPYGVVAARATDLIREAGYHSAGEKADPQKTIEAKGLNGGEVTMLAETFGRAEVVPPAAFADTLKQGRPVLVGLVYPTRDPNSDPLAQHQVVLTKTFLHEGARWYEMMNSHQGPWERQYLSEKELRAILYAKGVAYSPEPGTVVKPLK